MDYKYYLMTDINDKYRNFDWIIMSNYGLKDMWTMREKTFLIVGARATISLS